jgi:hypothetical protein
MNTFKIRKYGDSSAYLGTVSTNFAFVPTPELKIIKLTSFILITTMAYFFATR